MAGSSLQPALITLLYVFPALALFVVIVRVWKKRVDRTLGGDDALIVIAWILCLVNSILTHLYVVASYVGYYPQDVPTEKIDQIYAQKLQYALSLEYNPVVCIVKASFLWSLYKLASRNVWIRRAIWTLQIINGAYMVGAFIAGIVPCIPLEKRFNFMLEGKCYDLYSFVLANVSLVLITDFLVLLIPTWMIYDLQMSVRRKLITISFLSLGLVVIAIGILRLIWLTKAFKGKVNNHSVESAYSAIESSIAIIGASGPTVKFLLSRIFPCLKTASETSKKASNYGNSSSQHGISRRTRSKYNTNAYDDLDSERSVQHEAIEMKNDWRWTSKKDSDAHSDEQRITMDVNEGIVKTVDWTISTREDSMHAGRPMPKGTDRVAVQPANVV